MSFVKFLLHVIKKYKENKVDSEPDDSSITDSSNESSEQSNSISDKD